jgi:beta-galactosidase
VKSEFVQQLQAAKTTEVKPGEFFKGAFTLTNTGDTYLDMSNFKKGMVWVNGHNLGRYWEIGPQKRLYCPAPWLKKGENEIVVFDQHQLEAATVKGEKTLE